MQIRLAKLQLEELEFRVFNIFNIDTQAYMDWIDVVDFCSVHNLKLVPVLHLPKDFEYTVENFIKFAEMQTYGSTKPAEGIVVKTIDNIPRISFKVISNKYLLKHKL